MARFYSLMLTYSVRAWSLLFFFLFIVILLCCFVLCLYCLLRFYFIINKRSKVNQHQLLKNFQVDLKHSIEEIINIVWPAEKWRILTNNIYIFINRKGEQAGFLICEKSFHFRNAIQLCNCFSLSQRGV